MRLAVSVLTCVVVSVMTNALADPAASPTAPASSVRAAPAAATPAPAAAAEAHQAASTAPAAGEHPAVEIDAAQMDQLEKHFLAEGYKVEMHNGEKYFCRREDQLGSRLGGQKQCSSAQQLMFTEKNARREAEHAQHNQTSSPK